MLHFYLDQFQIRYLLNGTMHGHVQTEFGLDPPIRNTNSQKTMEYCNRLNNKDINKAVSLKYSILQ